MIDKTSAKNIALHFVETTGNRMTSIIMAKTINQVKALLTDGYTEQEIIEVIDHINAKGVVMYSFGYVNTCINNVLHEIGEIKANQTKANLKNTIRMMNEQEKAEVITHKSNNKRKLTGFGINNEHKYDSIF